MKHALLMVRVSTPGQVEDSDSLEDQARDLLKLAKQTAPGLPILDPPLFKGQSKLPPHVFGDPGITGDTLEGRPGMMAALDVVKTGVVGAVLVRDVNRLARDELVSQRIYQVLEQHHVRLITEQMEYDWNNLQHRLMLGLMGSIEAYAKRWLVMNMKRARDNKKARGEWGNASFPYGYRWQSPDRQAKIPGRPVAIPEEIVTVLEIFRLCVKDGLPCQAIAERLQAQGTLTRRGRRWTGNQVWTILRATCYKGEWFVDASAKVRSKDFTEAVIDPKTWAAAQRVIDNHKTHHGPVTKRDFLLTGIAFCKCGSAMGGRHTQGRDSQRAYVYYVCDAASRKSSDCTGRHIHAPLLDEPVWAMVEALARDPKQIEKLLVATQKDQLPQWRRALTQAQKALEELKFDEALVDKAYRKRVTSLEKYRQELGAIAQERAGLTREKEQLERLIEGEEIRAQTVDRVRTEMAAVGQRLDSMTVAGRRDLLRRLAFRIRVAPDGSRARVEFAGAPFLASEGLLPVSTFIDRGVDCPT